LTLTPMAMEALTEIKRGDVFNVIQAENNLPTGSEMWANRPAVIISNNATNNKSSIVNVVYLTTKNKRPMPYHITFPLNNKEATAICEQVFTVDKSRLRSYIGHIRDVDLQAIDQGVLFALGIGNTVHPSSLFDKWVNYVEKNDILLGDYDNDEITLLREENQRLKKQNSALKTLFATDVLQEREE